MASPETHTPLDKSDTNATSSSGVQDPNFYTKYGPLAHVTTTGSRLPAFGGELQPGLYRPVEARKFANPAPLGLGGFALTTFVLGCINMGARNITQPNIVASLAYAYGGLAQLLAGMWEMAAGNTFGATALSSYGGFWISLGIIFTPGGFNIMSTLIEADNGSPGMFYDSFALFLFGWFIFTFLLLLCTVKSTVAFFSLFLSVDIAFLLLAVGYMRRDGLGNPNENVIKAGGFFALIAAFLAWWCTFAGIADDSNSFFIPYALYFPWSERPKSRSKEE